MVPERVGVARNARRQRDVAATRQSRRARGMRASSRSMSASVVSGGRHCVPRQTHAAAPRPAPRLSRARAAASPPATSSTRTDGRSVRSSARCQSRQVAGSPRAAPMVGGSTASSSAMSSDEQPAGDARQRRREGAHRALGRFDIARLRRQMTERDQRLRRDAVARRRRVVVSGLRAMDRAARDRGW